MFFFIRIVWKLKKRRKKTKKCRLFFAASVSFFLKQNTDKKTTADFFLLPLRTHKHFVVIVITIFKVEEGINVKICYDTFFTYDYIYYLYSWFWNFTWHQSWWSARTVLTGWPRSYRVSVLGRMRNLQYIFAVTSGSPSIWT